MKKVILSMAMALMVSVAFGQTVSQLIEKYKAMPGSEYEEKTRDSLLAEMLTDEELMAQGVSKEESAFIRKNLKRSEQVTLQLDSIQQEVLNRDIQALKGYELLMVVNENNAPDEEANILQQMFSHVLNPQSKVAVYGRVKKNMVDDVLIRWDIWNKVVLSHLDCKIKKESLSKVIQLGDDWSIVERETDDVVDMKDVLEDVKNGNVLFVINGEEHPELHSLDEAKAYMDAKDFHFNNESWIVGSAVKEKYPNTDKKVVIEWWNRSDFSKMSAEEMKKEIMNCVILLNGKYRPEFHNEDEVIKYLSDEDGVLNGEYGIRYYFNQEKASKYDKTKKVVADITFTEVEDEK